MAETPFSPESGATSGSTAPEDGNLGSPVQPPAGFSPEPVPAPPEASEVPAAVEAVSPDPLPSAPEAVAAPEVPASPPEPAAAAPAFSAAPAQTVASEPADVAEPSQAPPPEQPAPPAGVAATITVPPLEDAGTGGGGEWELLVERFTTWWNSGELNRQWQRIRGPLKGVAILVAVLLALQVYATVVRTIDGIPLVSGLLELTGLIVVLQFGATRLLRSSDRQEVIAHLQRRWLDFRGRN